MKTLLTTILILLTLLFGGCSNSEISKSEQARMKTKKDGLEEIYKMIDNRAESGRTELVVFSYINSLQIKELEKQGFYVSIYRGNPNYHIIKW